MTKRSVILTILVQTICWSIVAWMFLVNSQQPVLARIQASTPSPFLGPIYYGQEDILAVFDHEFPLFSPVDDNNDDVRHYNGFLYEAVTSTPTSLPHIPVPGFGYDQHVGVDYTLQYEPVLASADGTVTEAGWSDPSDHRRLYGLYVRMEHADPSYRVWYGHLSTLNVETGDTITIDPFDPQNRSRILGISGNTGSVFGNNCDPDSEPTCGAHLHFEVRQININRPVNPYGWIGLTPLPSGTPVVDPWSLYVDPQGTPGATSYDLWEEKPAVLPVTDQYPGGTPLEDPGVNNVRMIIDDASADFVTAGPCTWIQTGGGNAYNNGYHRVPSDISSACTATWAIEGDAFAPAGDYDLFVHIPYDVDASLGVEYTVQHNGQTSVAVIVQAAYQPGNTEHDAWAYLGRYDFAMDSASAEFVRLDSETIIQDPGGYVLADAIKLAPADETPPPRDFVYVSFAGDGMVGNVAYNDEDVLALNTQTGAWRLIFDGSDVGLGGLDLDAFGYRNNNLYFSLDQTYGTFVDADVIQFKPTLLGDTTSGTMKMGLAGGPDLSAGTEDVDAVSFNSQGRYLRSTIGTAVVPGFSFEDEDVFLHAPYQFYLDGSAIGLDEESEDVDGVWADDNGDKYLSMVGDFAVSGSSGDGADVMRCVPGIWNPHTCTAVAGLFWNGSAHGLGSDVIDTLYLGSYIPLATLCGLGPQNCGFEEQFTHWTIQVDNPENENWVLTMDEYHTGWYSAMAEASFPDTGDALLISSPVSVSSTGVKYQFNFYGKGIAGSLFEINADAYWYYNDQLLHVSNIDTVEDDDEFWTLFSTSFQCPWPGANKAVIVFDIDDISLIQAETPLAENEEAGGGIFIDDVKIVSQPGNCPTLNQ